MTAARLFNDEASAEGRYRNGATRARLQPHPRDEHRGYSAADGRNQGIAKGLVYRLAQFKPLLAKRFETTKTQSGHWQPEFAVMHNAAHSMVG